MITFFTSIVALILGYIFYGKLVEKIFGADGNRETPAINMNDGVDYMPLPKWKTFLIQNYLLLDRSKVYCIFLVILISNKLLV